MRRKNAGMQQITWRVLVKRQSRAAHHEYVHEGGGYLLAPLEDHEGMPPLCYPRELREVLGGESLTAYLHPITLTSSRNAPSVCASSSVRANENGTVNSTTNPTRAYSGP